MTTISTNDKDRDDIDTDDDNDITLHDNDVCNGNDAE